MSDDKYELAYILLLFSFLYECTAYNHRDESVWCTVVQKICLHTSFSLNFISTSSKN